MRIDPTTGITAQVRALRLVNYCFRDETMVYRFYDAAGDLLYVGVTGNPANRWAAHQWKAEWWPLVASVSVEKHPYMNAALDAEVAAIHGEFPRFNLRSAAERPAGDSAPDCGTPPQGKGREGIGIGREQNPWLSLSASAVCNATPATVPTAPRLSTPSPVARAAASKDTGRWGQ